MSGNALFLNFALLAFLLPAGRPAPASATDMEKLLLIDSRTIRTFFDPDMVLTNAGLKFEAPGHMSIEPLLGLGYEVREQDSSLGRGETARVSARAGWKMNVDENVSFTMSAKLPVYSRETAGENPGDLSVRQTTSRSTYDLLQRPGENVSLSSSMGIRVGEKSELNIFYDQSPTGYAPAGSRSGLKEERFGTRFIFRFP